MDYNELSLLDLYNRLTDMKSTYDAKILALYDMYKPNSKLPDGVTNTNDGPGLWPSDGVNVYNIINSYGMSSAFCDTGVVVNVASAQDKFQLMLVETCTVDPTRNGRLLYRYIDSTTGAWSSWSTIATTADIDKLKTGSITVDHAVHADRLSTARTINLAGAVTGAVAFDGSVDVTLNTTAATLVPLNVTITPQYYATRVYQLLCTLPVNNASSYDQVMIVGNIGGWQASNGKANINVLVTNREYVYASGLVLGFLGSVDLTVVTNANGTLGVYLEYSNFVEQCNLSVYGSQVTLGSGASSTTPPTGNVVWRLSADGAFINGKSSNITTSGKASTAGVADAATTIHTVQSSAQGSILAISGDNTTPFFTPSIRLNAATGTVYAPEFSGKFTGTADHALKADVCLGADPVNNNTIKAYLLGVPDGSHTMYYDAFTYLDVSAGKLHASEFAGDRVTVNSISTSSITTNSAQVNGLTTTYGVAVMGASPNIDFNYGNSASPTSRLTATSPGMLTCTGEFTASRIHNAVWNDYAEYFPRGGTTEPGDVIMLNTAAADENYVKATEGAALVVGVHSDEYGHIVGGNEPPMGMSFADYNDVNFIPVALAGRVRVNFTGVSTKGLPVVATNDGCARLYSAKVDALEDIFGYLVESDTAVTKRRLKIKLK